MKKKLFFRDPVPDRGEDHAPSADAGRRGRESVTAVNTCSIPDDSHHIKLII